MIQSPSLFAQKLRAWRAQNGAHGRMTQEELADRLDVSLDAISKYERSLSFIRGDLEHRLSERLNWGRDDIVACRQDWELRQQKPTRGGYRLLDEAAVKANYNASWTEAICDLIHVAEREFGDLPDELAASEKIYLPIYNAYRDHWAAVMRDGRLIALWSLVFLHSEDERQFRRGRLIESEFNLDRVRQPLLPGTYFGYCTGLAVCRGHEAAAPILLSSFARFLEDLTARDVLLHGLGTITISNGGSQICQDLGMTRLGGHRLGPNYGVWELPGAAIADSIFARRSPFLRRSYAHAFG